MFCPLMNRECIKEKCAWFVPAEEPDTDWTGDCAISLTAGSLRNVADIEEDIGFDLYKLRIGDDSK